MSRVQEPRCRGARRWAGSDGPSGSSSGWPRKPPARRRAALRARALRPPAADRQRASRNRIRPAKTARAAMARARDGTIPVRGTRALDLLNFFVADVQTGFGPFVAIYLTVHKWPQTDIGMALSLGTVVALVSGIRATCWSMPPKASAGSPARDWSASWLPCSCSRYGRRNCRYCSPRAARGRQLPGVASDRRDQPEPRRAPRTGRRLGRNARFALDRQRPRRRRDGAERAGPVPAG